jgi:hypothetical protein
MIGCERKGVELPSPTGPATTAKILTVIANPNTIVAGNTRQISIITATLKYYDDTPIANMKLIFEICDVNGLKVNIGYFEGNENTITRITDSNGNVQVKYYGPLVSEVNRHVTVYIWVFASEKGEHFIMEKIPIFIIPIHY